MEESSDCESSVIPIALQLAELAEIPDSEKNMIEEINDSEITTPTESPVKTDVLLTNVKDSPDVEENTTEPASDGVNGKALTIVNLDLKEHTTDKQNEDEQESNIPKWDENDFTPPSDLLVEKIVHEAERYFSDFNLFKNNFLFKHVRRNKDGYISLKLLASFRKVKGLTKDWRVVIFSLEKSTKLELNVDGTKVRRIAPIPKIRDMAEGKTVMIFHLPPLTQTPEELTEMFSKFGKVVSAEVLTPLSETFNAYHKRCLFFNPELYSDIFGTVEFEKFEHAQNAIKDEDSHLPKENEMKVVPLLPYLNPLKHSTYKHRQRRRYCRGGKGVIQQQPDFKNGETPADNGDASKPSNDEKIPQNQRRSHPPVNGNQVFDPNVSNHVKILPPVGYFGDRDSNSWFQRRQLRDNNTMNIGRAAVITRNPKGPDSQVGFLETRI